MMNSVSRLDRVAIRIALALCAALVVAAAVSLVEVALAQSTVDAVAADLCSNDGALIHWAWAAVGSAPAVASALAAVAVVLRRWMPAPIAKLLYALSLNWLKDLADRAAAKPAPSSADPAPGSGAD
jgi:hypothetical protein